MVKNPTCNAGATADLDSIPGSLRSPGGGHGNPLQYSCLENPMDREAWWATVHGVAKSRTRLELLSMHTYMYLSTYKNNIFILHQFVNIYLSIQYYRLR